MKYIPSAVHLPQHSFGGLCHPSSRRCRPVPSAATSHSCCWPIVPAVSEEPNRRWVLSGDQLTLRMSPLTLNSLRDPLPSALATNKSPRLVYASHLPSGEHTAVSATMSSSLRGEPPIIG